MKRTVCALAACLSVTAAPLMAGTMGNVVAFGDEWTLSDAAYDGSNAGGDFYAGDRASTERLVGNLSSFLGGTNYLIATNNAYAYGSDFQANLAGAEGKTVSRVNTQAGFDAALSSADVVFLAGTIGAGSAASLNSFIAGGGSVVVSLGTGNFGTAVGEAAAWNGFLGTYGLAAQNIWTLLPRWTPLSVIDGATGLDDGVANLLWGYGNQIQLVGPSPQNGLVTGTFGGSTASAIGTYNGMPATAPVPLPAGLPLVLSGLGALALTRRRKG